jgi:hypothetical protein
MLPTPPEIKTLLSLPKSSADPTAQNKYKNSPQVMPLISFKHD